MSRRFALATARDIHPNGPLEDAMVIEALHKLGAQARTVVWDETDPASLGGEEVVIRTPWNYQDHFPRFVRWLEEVSNTAQGLVNPLALLLGTIDKRYLADFRARGYRVPETVLVETQAALEDVLARPRFADAIAKPAVGGGARGLVRVRRGDGPARGRVDLRVPYIVQPFIPEIETVGELTFVFFGGTFSHAVRKRGAPGDFRVQVDWGGTVEVIDPPQRQIEEAARFLTALDQPTAYARVDVVEVDGGLTLMELEVIEPELFCLYVPGTAEKFAKALIDF